MSCIFVFLQNKLIFENIGKIAAANVLSDLYAMGVTECDNMLMLIGVSTKMTEKERDIVMPLMMRGFKVILYFYRIFFKFFYKNYVYRIVPWRPVPM